MMFKARQIPVLIKMHLLARNNSKLQVFITSQDVRVQSKDGSVSALSIWHDNTAMMTSLKRKKNTAKYVTKMCLISYL